MFTGRITEIGVIESVSTDHIRVRIKRGSDAQPGGAIAVNGVRLTIDEIDGDVFRSALSAETRHRSTIDETSVGDAVQIEHPLTVGDVLAGHLVQGYVDGVGKVLRVDEGDDLSGRRIWIRPSSRVLRQLVAKTPIAVDGVSLTIADVARDRFSVVVLPVTATSTTLGELVVGQRVNIELDVMNKVGATPRARETSNRIVTNLPWAGEVSGPEGVGKIVAQIAAGGAAVIWDPDTEGEGDVIFAAAAVKPEAFTFLLTEVCGFPAVPCCPEVLRKLEIPLLPGSGDKHGTAFCSPVDYVGNPGTGVSAEERAATVRRLANPDARPTDFLRPGHVSPLAAREGLLAERAGHTEATVALCKAAGLPGVGVCCEIMNPDGTMANDAEVELFALRHGLPAISIGTLRSYL